MYLLNIETATKNCSVTVSQNGKTVLCKELATEGYSHAEKLHVFIEELLNETNITYNDLVAIAVSKGPGSYTGLRIGVSAAKGLCYALNIPLIAIDTLTLLASQVIENDGLIIPMIDARRMEVYSAVYNSNKDMIREVKAEIITEESFADYTEKIYFVGDSNAKAKSILINSNFIFKDDIVYPTSACMSELSYKKFLDSEFEDVAYFEPYYLKDFMIIK